MNAELFSEALGEVRDSYIEEAIRYQRSLQKRRLARWGISAACLALLLAACSLFLPFRRKTTVTVYARGTDEEITAAGAVLITGTISDSGKMKGKPLMFYLSGEDIASVRFSCKNQLLTFMDWTEKREEYGKAGNFTVAYGEDTSEYYYLTIDWTPDTIIRELTDNPSSTVAGLPEDMRRDIIVLEITFGNGETATKAIQVSLLDDGTFFASFDDYEIGPADTFVKRPDAPAIPRDILYAQGSETVSSSADAPPMVYVNGTLYRQYPQQISYEEKKAGFLYLGSIQSHVNGDGQHTVEESDISADGTLQHAADGIPKENLQANTPIVGAEVYQYNNDIAVLTDGKYWLYEPLSGEGAPVEHEIPEGLTEDGKMLLDPSYTAPESSTQTPDTTGTDRNTENSSSAESNPNPEDSSEKNDFHAAEAAARAYYAGTVFEVVSLEPESRENGTVVFSVTVRKGGVVQEPERTITLQPNQGTWEVINEGY